MSLLDSSQGRGDFTILKIVYYLENYIGSDDWQCRYMRGRALMYVVLGEEEEQVPYKETVCTTECETL